MDWLDRLSKSPLHPIDFRSRQYSYWESTVITSLNIRQKPILLLRIFIVFTFSFLYTIGGEPIRVARVVVVDIARRVDIPRIIRIAPVRRAQPNVLN